MGRSITIHDVPDETANELTVRAAATGRSLQEYLRAALIELARRPDPKIFFVRRRARKARTGSRLDPDDILSHRDVGRSNPP